MQHLRAGVVGPLDVVHHENGRTTVSRCLEELVHCTRQARLPCLGKIVRQPRQVRKTLAYLGNQGGEFGERHGRQIAQRSGRYAVERARDEVDHGLVRHRAFDLVAFCRERRQVLCIRIACDLAQQPALADTRLAFDQDGVPDAGGEPRDKSDEQTVLVTSADEGCGIARGADCRIERRMDRCDGRVGADRHGVQSQTVRGMHRTCRSEEIAALLLGYGERRGEPFSEPPRWATLVGLDLSDCETRAADPLGERLLGEIQCFAAPPQPVAKRICPVLHVVRPSVASDAFESSSLVRAFVPLFVPLCGTPRPLPWSGIAPCRSAL